MYIIIPGTQMAEWFQVGQEREVAFNMLKTARALGGPVKKSEIEGEPAYESLPGLKYFTDGGGNCHLQWEDLTPLQRAANAAGDIRLN